MERIPVAIFRIVWSPNLARQTRTRSGTILIAADPLAPGQHPLPAARQEGRMVSTLFAGSQLLVGESGNQATNASAPSAV